MRFDYLLYYIVAFVDIASAVVSARLTSPSVLDLMQHMGGNVSGQAMKLIPGINAQSTAHLFLDSRRHVEVTHKAVKKIKRLLEANEEFTIITAIRQKEKTSGSILSFFLRDVRFFELESSGRRDELRLHYFHSGRLRTETFPYRIADNQWHTIALSFSRDYVEVFIDCRKIYERSLVWLEWTGSPRRMSIFIGQRGPSHAFFKGAIEYISIIGEPHGVLHLCPHANIACPTCSEFRHLQHSIEKLYEHIEILSDKLTRAEKRITELEQCDCQLSCTVNGTQYKNKDTWNPNICTSCVCKNGVVECQEQQCPQLNCKYPVPIPGHCCPICRKQCYVHGVYYDDGQTYSPEDPSSKSSSCVICKCNDGSPQCHQITCEDPQCPEEDQFEAPGECCRRCKGTDFCQMGNDCHQNASCYNLETQYKCECNRGFRGDGKHCHDIDECQEAGGMDGHYCGHNARCINTLGSYTCLCETGFIRNAEHNYCEEHDECATGRHSCDHNARCINVYSGYRCTCNRGWDGDGFTCKAQCREKCENGGICIEPNICQCRKGYFGRSCTEELDECSLGMHNCHPNSECVNVPGSYQCRCRSGYYSNTAENQHGQLCQDLNECLGWGEGNNCPEGSSCRNTPGGHECICINPALCGGCMDGSIWHVNGTSWRPTNSSCTILHCIDDKIKSQEIECNCKESTVDLACCPQCEEQDQCVFHGKTYRNGHQWLQQCQQCQCLEGEVDCWPMECPRLSCKTLLLEGDCCPRCDHDHDPCHAAYKNTNSLVHDANRSCDFKNNTYSNGRTWTLASDHCTQCQCKEGHVCCQYNQNCRRRNKLRKRARFLKARRRSRRRHMKKG